MTPLCNSENGWRHADNPAACPRCRMAARGPAFAAVIDRQDGVTPPAPPDECPHLGAELTGPERQAVGLSHAKRWALCTHPDQPLGPYVCPCAGCGPRCKGHPSYRPTAVVRKPTPPRPAPAGRWADVPPPPPIAFTPTRPRAVVTVAVGEEGRRLLAASGGHLRRYAERCDADFVILDDYEGPEGFRVGAKWGIVRTLGPWERIAAIDADTLPTPRSVNVFDLCGEDEFGAVDELAHHRGDGVIDNYADFRRMMGFPAAPALHYFNAGVMVIPASHRAVIEPPARAWLGAARFASHCAEQDWMNARLMLLGLPFRPIDRRANWQNWTDRGFRRCPPDAIRHWSGAVGTDRRSRPAMIRAAAVAAPWPAD